ncbi:class F sortase [Metabacillus sp. 84]|uniref:class F sortase n=1 Tax=Metabacillus sp. 84 TaxID=3404705 RepID=UPI003CF4DA70
MGKRKALSNVLLLGILAGCGSAGDEAADLTAPVKSEPKPAASLKFAAASDQPSQSEQEGIVPESIEIPKLGIVTAVEKTGLLEDGSMGVPEKDENTAWYKQGAKPGDYGNAVIAGHVDNKTGPAVFFKLNSLTPGDEVLITDAKGTKLTFIVEQAEAYPYDDAPIQQIFGPSDRKGLNLITCTGIYDQSKRTHLERLVVYTVLKDEPA